MTINICNSEKSIESCHSNKDIFLTDFFCYLFFSIIFFFQLINSIISDFPVVTVGPDNPYRVELDHTAEMVCEVDSKPATDSVRWEFSGRFIDTNFRHVIPQVSLQDAGSYYCSGDNGLGHVDKEELILDVQYGPQV